jgi:hypothetical protein
MKRYASFQDIYGNRASIRNFAAHRLVYIVIYVNFCIWNTIQQLYLAHFP